MYRIVLITIATIVKTIRTDHTDFDDNITVTPQTVVLVTLAFVTFHESAVMRGRTEITFILSAFLFDNLKSKSVTVRIMIFAYLLNLTEFESVFIFVNKVKTMYNSS